MALSFTYLGKKHSFVKSPQSKIGSGGEGEIHRVLFDGKTYAAKIFHKISLEKLAKIKAAIGLIPANAIYEDSDFVLVQLAWPLALIFEDGKEVGFLMPYLETRETLDLQFYTNPVLHNDKRHIEPVNLPAKVQIARNLCAVVKSLHDVGHYFVDFKPENVRVYKKTKQVCLIDCDSYSIWDGKSRFPGSAFSSEYINPLALVNSLPPSELSISQDRWAIAVALFKLFNLGIHPYSGIISSAISTESIDDNVRMGLYAYGRAANPLISPKPSSVHQLFTDQLRDFFDKAFNQLDVPPSMGEWVEYFDSLLVEKKFQKCDKFPTNLDHVRFQGFDCIACKMSGYKSVSKKSKLNSQNSSASNSSSFQSSSVPAASYNNRFQTSTSNLPNNSKTDGKLIYIVSTLLVLLLIILSNFDSSGPQQSTQSQLSNLSTAKSVKFSNGMSEPLISLSVRSVKQRPGWGLNLLEINKHLNFNDGINFYLFPEECLYDVRAEWKNGESNIIKDFDLCSSSEYRLRYSGEEVNSDKAESGGFVALYISDRRAVGYSIGGTSENEARGLALRECKKQISDNGDSCRRLISTRARCVSFSRAPNGAFGASAGQDAGETARSAQKLCENSGGQDCSPARENTFCN